MADPKLEIEEARDAKKPPPFLGSLGAISPRRGLRAPAIKKSRERERGVGGNLKERDSSIMEEQR